MARPDISEVKRRIQGEEAAPASSRPQESDKPRISAETDRQVSDFIAATRELNAEDERIELEELPEGINVREDRVFYQNNAYDNKKVRAKIESRCSEIDFSELVLNGRVTQSIPIIPGKLEIVLQSLTGRETFWIQKKAEAAALSDMTIASWAGYARLAMSMTSINGTRTPGYLKDGEIHDDGFESQLDAVMGHSEITLRVLLTNLGWFMDRVEGLLDNDFELLKNG